MNITETINGTNGTNGTDSNDLYDGENGFQISGFNITIVVSAIFGTFFLLWFYFGRFYWKWFYQPKSTFFFREKSWAIDKEVSNSWLLWIWYVYQYDERDLYEQKGGFDCIIYLRFLRSCTLLFGAFTFWGLVVVLPVNFTGTNKDLDPSDPLYTQNNAVYGMANLSQASPRLHLHAFTLGLFTAAVWYTQWRMYRTAIELNVLEHNKNHLRARTIMVTEMDGRTARSNASMMETFQGIYRKAVLMTQAVPKNGTLHDLAEDREILVSKFKQTCEEYVSNGSNERPTLGFMHMLQLDLPKSVWASLQNQQMKRFFQTAGGNLLDVIPLPKLMKKKNRSTGTTEISTPMDLTEEVEMDDQHEKFLTTLDEMSPDRDLEIGVDLQRMNKRLAKQDMKNPDDVDLPEWEDATVEKSVQTLYLCQETKLYKKYISKEAKSGDRLRAMLVEPADIEAEELPLDYFDDPPPLPSEQRKPHGIDMIDFFETAIQSIDEKMLKKQKKLRKFVQLQHASDLIHTYDPQSQPDKRVRMTRVGFVTFKYVSTAQCCAQSRHSGYNKRFMTQMAPDHKDIVWKNLSCRQREQSIRMIIVAAALVGLFSFYTIPVTAISAVTNLGYLGTISWLKPIVDWLQSNYYLGGVVGGFLPTLALQLFMAILPWILTKIMRHSKYYTRTQLEMGVMKAFWVFLLLNVFLVTSLAGSVIQTIQQILQTPDLLVNLLAGALPKQAEFFIEYMIISAFVQYPYELSNMLDLGIIMAQCYFFSRTEQERREIKSEKENYDYVENFANEMLSFSIGLAYSVMQPIILPFTLIFFVIAHFNAKYRFIFIVRTAYEGYNLLPTMMLFMTVSVLIFQATMVGLFALQLFPTGTIFSAVCIVLTAIVHMLLVAHYEKSITFVPLRHCDPQKLTNVDDIEKIARWYQDPVQMKPESIYNGIKHLRRDEAEGDVDSDVEEVHPTRSKAAALGAALLAVNAVGRFMKKAVQQGKNLDNLTKGSLEKTAYRSPVVTSDGATSSPDLSTRSPMRSRLKKKDSDGESDDDYYQTTHSDTDTETDEEMDYRKKD